MEYKYTTKILGIKYGKYCDGVLHILYEQNNMFGINDVKKRISKNKEERVHYFVLKERFNRKFGYSLCMYDWMECEKEVILDITAD